MLVPLATRSSLGPLASGAPAGGPPLLSGMIEYWTLHEESGTRASSVVGGHDLTDDNTVGYGVGPDSENCASFVKANSERLSIIGAGGVDPTLGGTSSFSVSLWMNYPDWTGNLGLIAQGTIWCVDTNVGGARFYVNLGAGIVAQGLGALSQNTWHHILGTYDITAGANGTVYLWVDGVSVGSNASTSKPNAAGNALTIGSRDTSIYYGGLISAVGLWTRVLTTDERTDLETKFYPFS